jgi:hypothetical protein
MDQYKKIDTSIGIGDAGIPVDVTIHVWYRVDGDTVVVTSSEDEVSLDNVPHWWPEKIGDIIEESFDGKVIFE